VKEKLKEAPAAMPGMPGGMPDFSNMGAAMEQMMQNPQMRQMAENMMQNPQMQGMMQNMMGQMGMPMPPMGGEEGGAPAGMPAGLPDMGAGLPDMGAGGGFNPGTVKIRFWWNSDNLNVKKRYLKNTSSCYASGYADGARNDEKQPRASRGDAKNVPGNGRTAPVGKSRKHERDYRDWFTPKNFTWPLLFKPFLLLDSPYTVFS
jgi:hypothetical protein